MDIVYTWHAKLQISKRKVDFVWIEEVIKNPDLVVKKEGKHYFKKKLNGFVLEISCEKTENYIKVITVYWI